MDRIRVLVVEDDLSARDLLVAILEDDGYEVLALSEGSAALVAAPSFKPDLALLDSGLPGITGGEVARRLRQTSDLPIIFVTGANSAEDIHSGFKVGADATSSSLSTRKSCPGECGLSCVGPAAP